MEILSLILLVIFIILSLALVAIIYYEYRELKRYNAEFTLLASAISEVADVINKNAESSRQETALLRETALEVVLIKQVLDVHAKALAYTVPAKQWEELLEAVRKSVRGES